MSLASPTTGVTGVPLVPSRLHRDERLARLAADGNREAFAIIYERYHQVLYRYCHSILGNREDAFDALQNTMARVLRALPGETREIALKPWLHRIAHNESIRLLGARRPDVSLEEAPELLGPDPELQREARERLRQLALDLRELSEQQRGALLMRDVSGLAHGEIAVALGISEAAAKQAVYEAGVALHEAAKGREMDCEAVTRALALRDGRVLRGRKLRGHLRDCRDCREFQAALGQRKADLGALAPPLAAPAAAALVEQLVGASASASAGGGGGLLGLLGGGAGKTVGTAIVVKGMAAVVVAGGLGLGAAQLAERGGSHEASVVPAPDVQETGGATGQARSRSRQAPASGRAGRRPDSSARRQRGRESPSAPRSGSGTGDAGPGSPSPAAPPVSAPSPGFPGIERDREQSGGHVPSGRPVSPPGRPKRGRQQSQAPPGNQVPHGRPVPSGRPTPGRQVPDGRPVPPGRPKPRRQLPQGTGKPPTRDSAPR